MFSHGRALLLLLRHNDAANVGLVLLRCEHRANVESFAVAAHAGEKLLDVDDLRHGVAGLRDVG